MKNIGKVIDYLTRSKVAIIRLDNGELNIGNPIKISKRNGKSDLIQLATSIEIDKRKVSRAVAGEIIGLEVLERVRKNDNLYLINNNEEKLRRIVRAIHDRYTYNGRLLKILMESETHNIYETLDKFLKSVNE